MFDRKKINALNRNVILLLGFWISSYHSLKAQLDDIHYIPPLAVDYEWRNGTHSARDHYIILTTPETTPFKVFLENGNFNPITNYTLITGTGNAVTGFNLSKTTPVKIRLSTVASAAHNSHGIITRTEFNAINTADGIIAKGSKPFFCNIRHLSNAQGESMSCKGKNALGTAFRAGFANHVSSSGTDWLNSFISVMATQNNTEVVFTNFRNFVSFFGSPAGAGDSIKIVLDAGESYVIGNEAEFLPFNFNDLNNFNGIEVYSSKPIAMNTGSWLSGGNGTSRDIGFDQNVPVTKAGTDFVLIQGNGPTNRESATVVATNFFTSVYLNGSFIPSAILVFPGDYYVIPGTNYTANQNILVETDQPVLVYQKMFGSTSDATNSMNLIPPLNECSGSGEVVLHDVRQFGSGELFMTARLGSTVRVYENGALTATYNPVTSNITGAGGSNWRSIKHLVTAATPVDIVVQSTNIINVGFFGASGAIGAAGYFSGFETPPTIKGDSTLCTQNSMYLYVTDTFGISAFNWYRNGSLIDSAGSDSLLITDFGFYTVEGIYANCPGTTDLSYPFSVDQSLCSSPGGVQADLLWLKADDGPLNTSLAIPNNGNQVSIWFDRSDFSNDFLENDFGTTVTGPFFRTNFMNFNPTIGFLGNSGMKIDSSLIKHTDSAGTIISVVKMNNGNGTIFADLNEDSLSSISLKGNGRTEIVGTQHLSPLINVNTSEIYTIRKQSKAAGSSPIRNYYNASVFSSGSAPIASGTTAFSTLGYKYKDNLPSGVGSMMNGNISEIVLYDKALTPFELRKVHSYLAIKWGITLNGDYLSSFGDTIWDSIRNYPYIHDIAGIGKDFESSLRQKQSKSEKLDDILAVGLDSIRNSNNDNQGIFDRDSSFLIWGNNDSAIEVTLLELPLNLNSKRRLKREWKVQETYYSATDYMDRYDLWFDLSVISSSKFAGAGNYFILIDEDGDGNFNTGNIREVIFNKRNQDTIYFDNIDLDDGEVFTLGASVISPGCIIDDLTLWMRGDQGVSTTGINVDRWRSLVGSITLDAIDFAKPTYDNGLTNTFNYNPYLNFAGPLCRLSDSIYDLIYDYDATVIVVRVPGGLLETTVAYTNSLNQVYSINHTDAISNRRALINLNPSTTPQAVGFTYDTSTSTFYSIENGILTPDVTTIPYILLDGIGELVVGGNSLLDNYTGQIAEIIFYDRGLNTYDVEKVNSYIGLKYGITLNHLYRSSLDKIFWDLEENKGFNDQIVGVGRDDGSGLIQKKTYVWTKHFNMLVDSLNDQDFIMMGYNDDSKTYKINKTGETHNLTLEFLYPTVKSIQYSYDKNFENINILSIKDSKANFNLSQPEVYFKLDYEPLHTNINE